MTAIIKQKETFRRTLKLTDPKSGAYIDLTDCSAYSEMRKYPGGDLLGTATCTIQEKKGIIDVLWTSAQTATFPIGKAGYDVWLVVDAEKKPLFTEEVQIVRGYTENLGD